MFTVARQHSDAFPGFVDDISSFPQWALLQQVISVAVVMRMLTPLLHADGCILSYMMASAKTRRVHQAGVPAVECVMYKGKGKSKRRSVSSNLASPLRELTCHMGSHSVNCHVAEVTFPPLPPAEAGT